MTWQVHRRSRGMIETSDPWSRVPDGGEAAVAWDRDVAPHLDDVPPGTTYKMYFETYGRPYVVFLGWFHQKHVFCKAVQFDGSIWHPLGLEYRQPLFEYLKEQP